MTQESAPRIIEEPSTHKKKMQAYLGMAIGVVFFILLGMVVLNVWNKMQERKAPPKVDEVTTTEPPAAADRQAQFNELAKNRTGRVLPSESGAGDINEQFNKIGNGVPPERNGRRGADERRASNDSDPDESPESKAVRQWKAKEELRALGAANKPWNGCSRRSSAHGCRSGHPCKHPGPDSAYEPSPG